MDSSTRIARRLLWVCQEQDQLHATAHGGRSPATTQSGALDIDGGKLWRSRLFRDRFALSLERLHMKRDGVACVGKRLVIRIALRVQARKRRDMDGISALVRVRHQQDGVAAHDPLLQQFDESLDGYAYIVENALKRSCLDDITRVHGHGDLLRTIRVSEAVMTASDT